ncbi:MAG: hypothetical protein ACJ779_08025 [Chloroflexota bacterium]
MLADYRSFIERPTSPLERGCTTKVAYTSRREARTRSRHGRHADGSLQAYHCRYCGGWHLGHRRGAFVSR